MLENENKIRSEYTIGSDVLYSLEDLQLGAKGDLTEFFPGRRLQLALGREGVSQYIYRVVLLDALQQSGAYMYHCGVFLVPKVCPRAGLPRNGSTLKGRIILSFLNFVIVQFHHSVAF